MNNRISPFVLALTLLPGAAQAALQGRDLNGSLDSFEAYYDTDLDITWLADANYAKTSGYDADGNMIWATATSWADNLSFTDGVNIYADWRLPTVKPINGSSFNYSHSDNGSTDQGHNISEQGTAYEGSTANEMAHLFYNTLDNKLYCPPESTSCVPGGGLTNTGPFTNLHGAYYWSGTSLPPSGTSFPPDYAWGFHFYLGYQTALPKDIEGSPALAVSPGDVGAIPEADTWAMLLAGLGLVGAAVRRRR